MRYELYLFLVDEYYQAYSAALTLQSKKCKPRSFDALQAFDVLAITSEIVSKFQTVYRDGIFSAPDNNHESWDFRTDNGLLWQILPQKVDDKPLDEYPSGYGHLIRIQIDWHHAEKFLPALVDIACRNGFFLADLQKEDLLLWSPQLLGNTGPFQCRERSGQIIEALQKKLKGIRAVAKIGEWTSYLGRKNFTRPVGNASYAVCLVRKCAFSGSLEDWTREFHAFLESVLFSDEKLSFSDRSFWVESEEGSYHISFCIEAYGKHPSLTVHMDTDKENGYEPVPGRLKVEPLCRAGTLELRKMAGRLCSERLKDSPIMRRLGLCMMKEQWPDPGQRLAASVRMEKGLSKIGMEFYYDSASKANRSQMILADVEFSTLGEQKDDTAALYMGESEFALLYPSIEKSISGGIQYYSFLNMVSPMQCGLIAADLKRLAWLFAHEPESPEVDKYLEAVWIDAIAPEDEWDFSHWELGKAPIEKQRECLIRYRKKLLALFSFAIDWFSARADDEDSADRAVNIMGL